MKRMLSNKLSVKIGASLIAASAASLTLITPAIADEQSTQPQAGSASTPEFSTLDRNSDGRLTQDELSVLAERGGQDPEAYLDRYDMDGDGALDENEFSQIDGTNSQSTSPARAGQSDEQEASAQGTQIEVRQRPTQVTVEKPPAQVTIEQPRPKVTITTQDPQVDVEQAEPRVSVEQGEPRVSVDQPEPEVSVREADPNVQVHESEPQVNVQRQEPEVEFRSAEGEQSSQQERLRQQEQGEQRGQLREQEQVRQQGQAGEQDESSPQGQQEQRAQAPMGTREQSDRNAASADQQQQDIYELPLEQLRNARVVDSSGQSIGVVEQVVIKRDASEAGLIISANGSAGEGPQLVYGAAENFTVQGNEIVLDPRTDVETLSQSQAFDAQEFRAAPEAGGTLGNLMGRRQGLSGR